MEYKEYREKIDIIFRRFTRGNFVDYFACSGLTEEMIELITDATEEFAARNEYKELFSLACKAFLKWGNTDKDDSDGETQTFCSYIIDAWNVVYDSNDKRIPHAKIFDWFMSKLDGCVIDCMEDYLYDYLAEHFKEPDLMQKKFDFYQAKISEGEAHPDDIHYSYQTKQFKEYMLKLLSDMDRPMEEIRDYARTITTTKSLEILAQIEKNHGNMKETIAIYRELAAEEDRRGIHIENWHIKLKNLFKDSGDAENYVIELKAALFANVGNRELWIEYKNLFSPQDWLAACEACFSRFKIENAGPFPWYAQEERYDLVMSGIEVCNDDIYLKQYEEKLKALYPDRCLAVLVTQTVWQADHSDNRKDYKKIAHMLRWIQKYPGGREKASELAESFRSKYPRRRAMLEELSRF